MMLTSIETLKIMITMPARIVKTSTRKKYIKHVTRGSNFGYKTGTKNEIQTKMM